MRNVLVSNGIAIVSCNRPSEGAQPPAARLAPVVLGKLVKDRCMQRRANPAALEMDSARMRHQRSQQS